MLDWFWNVLAWLGLWRRGGTLLLLGLDNAGKSTLLGLLSNGRVGQFQPTYHPNEELLELDGVSFRAIDLGGHKQARRLWAEYYVKCSGLIFLVDAADPGRFEEAYRELNAILTDEAMAEIPVLILGNKADLPTAVSEGQLLDAMHTSMLGLRKGHLALYMCSIKEKWGFAEGIRWLASKVQ